MALPVASFMAFSCTTGRAISSSNSAKDYPLRSIAKVSYRASTAAQMAHRLIWASCIVLDPIRSNAGAQQNGIESLRELLYPHLTQARIMNHSKVETEETGESLWVS